jgi:hypothetical protein
VQSQSRRALIGWMVQHLRAMLESGEADALTVRETIVRAVRRSMRACGLRRMP